MRNAVASLTLVLVALAGCAHSGSPPPTPVQIITEDVDRFYRIYDSSGGAPTAEALQHGYIDAGTSGVREFVPHRILSGKALAERIAKDRTVYENARRCVSALPRVRQRLAKSFRKLASIYPEAKFPPVTILIGRDNSGGTAGPTGVLIGLEVVCRPDAPDPNVDDRLVHLIAHEYAHVQQSEPVEGDPNAGTVLHQSLVEGVAELIAELTSGRISNIHLERWTEDKETQIEQAFLAGINSKDLSNWLYKGVGTPEKPGDLGYWIGYRIAKSYYDRAPDKRAAVRELLQLRNPHRILKESGWHPGVRT